MVKKDTNVLNYEVGMLTKWIILSLFLILCGLIGYIVGVQNIPSNETNVATTNTTPAPSTVTTTPTTTTTPADPTADWKTYTNDTYDFSFKYPAEWRITSDMASTSEPVYSVRLQNNSDNEVLLDIHKISDAGPTSLAQMKSDLTETAEKGNFQVSFTDVKVDSKTGMKTIYSNLTEDDKQLRGDTNISFINTGVFYSFRTFNEGTNKVDQILSTFNFISK